MTTYATPQTTARPATDKQLTFIRNLLAERAGNPAAESVRDWMNEARLAGALDTRTASSAIEQLLAIRKGVVSADGTPAPVAPAVVLEDGMYRRPSGEYVRVYHTIHGRNVQVAKVLAITETGVDADGKPTYSGEFEYAGKRGLAGLTPEMMLTEAEAKDFGMTYGFCVFGHKLNREESLHVGYGATCAANNGWWYPTKAELRALTGAALAEAAALG